jgi:phage FluMu protein Com
MSITFHCEHCGKKIEAPDAAGGKWGKCPGCKNKVYVPSKEAEDELKLAPLDTEDERKQRALYAETVRLRQEILNETEVPEEGVQPKKESSPPKPGC